MAQGAQLLQLPGAATRAQPARSEWYQLSGEPEKHNMAQRSAAIRGTLNEANSAHTHTHPCQPQMPRTCLEACIASRHPASTR